MSDKPHAIAPKAPPSAAAGAVTSGAATYEQVGDDYLAQRWLQKSAGWVLLSALGVGAVISYALVMLSYVKLAISQPQLPRPYKSPLGVPGAVLGTILALISLLATMAIPGNRPGVIGTAVFMVVMVIFFFAYSRNKLVAQAPEEAALVAAAQAELK